MAQPITVARRAVRLLPHPVRVWPRLSVGVLLGAGTALLEAVLGAVAGLAWLGTLGRPVARRALAARVSTVAHELVRWERRRMDRWYASDVSAPHPAPGGGTGAPTYLAVRVPVALAGAWVVLGASLLSVGSVIVAIGEGVVYGARSVHLNWPGVNLISNNVITGVLIGATLGYLAARLTLALASAERRLAARMLGPSQQDLLERRITELTASRAGVVEAVNTERRRIERDLHDGVQQRLVALSMLLGRARRAAAAAGAPAGELLDQAHDQTQRALDDLREVAWRVYPATLDDVGLSAALSGMAERSAVPVRLKYRLAERPPGPVEAAAYFVVCEAVTNAVKHAAASAIEVRVEPRGTAVAIRVHDDGAGGADPAGTGLSGLARRVAALDGAFAVHSPPGGPTTVTAELPCG
ncbi:sensor histidine kinase [Allonocardiopsis opalescens]|uniref:histidine kinase n=1 Tax=Allonocardiopsis opalescens TaxID=1144618 RepID=A0A2T0QAK1_9ACTN|nr:histidine kinase [Allonocardiopsis opalescens]PRY00884.1 signal transduction histidine kinase [Allonocardiopsis opalescens]